MRILPLSLTKVLVEREGDRLVGPLEMTVGAGGISVVMGPNGSGKSTLLKVCHGLVTPTSGTVAWAGDQAANARRHQAIVFQKPAVLRRSVRENVAYPLKLRGVPRAERLEKADQLIARARLNALADRDATVLSGGEQQKLAIVRAWITEPEVLFLDEPTASLDPGATRDIEALIGSIDAAGTKIVMTSHDLGQIKRLATDVLFLLDGLIKERGTVEQIFDSPQSETLAAFLRGDIVG